MFHPPSYHISHGPDKALKWDPPADSSELAIALSYHFPVEKTLKKKMQAAVAKFLQQAQSDCPTGMEAKHDIRPAEPRPSPEVIPGLLSFDVKTLEEVRSRRKRRAYEQTERAKVGSNRGNACEVHRRQKLKCDPTKCKRNAQFRHSHVDQPLNAMGSGNMSMNQQLQPLLSPQLNPPGSKTFNEPINLLFSWSSNTDIDHLALAQAEVPTTDHSPNSLTSNDPWRPVSASASQFMGFEGDISAVTNDHDSFSFFLDAPSFLNHGGETDERYSWKTDEFLLSVLSHSMFT